MIRNLWAYLLGYLVLVVQGEHPERLINLALARGVFLWDLVRVDEEVLLVKVYVDSYRALRHIARRTQCQIRIRAKCGLPFLFHRLRRRQALAGGAVVFCLLVYFLSSLVWTVEVTGTRRIAPATVKKLAAAAGLRPGALRFRIRGEAVAASLLRELPGLAFAEVDVRTQSRIKITEKVFPEKETGPCNIVAAKDGIIENLLVLAGSPVLKEGDLVRRGDVVISGAILPPAPEPESPDAATPAPQTAKPRYVAAKGIVRAHIWRRYYGEAPRSELREFKTGKVTNIVCMRMAQKEIIIKGPRRIPYLSYHLKVKQIEIPRWRSMNIPVEFVTIEAEEIRRVQVNRSYEDALRLALQSARQKMAQNLPGTVKVAKQQSRVVDAGDPDLVRVVLTVETIEDIGVSRQFRPPAEVPDVRQGE